MASSTRETLVGRTIAGKYAVESLLGSGAMGEVYKARQIALDKKVALKVMHASVALDPSFADRFQREARAASRLDHPNSIRVIDFGEEPDGLTYIAMEYVEGHDLHDVIQAEWPLSAARIANILIQAASALSVAHEMGVVHRDLKPENIMIVAGTDEEGRPTDIVKVLDFGIAKIMERSDSAGSTEAPKTTAGLIIGTPEYMSPEQGRGEPIDARTDIYSIGVILFELLTRRAPFTADTPIGIVVKHLTDEVPIPSRLNPAIDRRLEAICLKALRKQREERYQTARDLRTALRTILDEPGVPSSAFSARGATAETLVGVTGTETESGPTRILSAPQQSFAASAKTARAARATGAGWSRWVGLAALAGVVFGVTRIVIPWLRGVDSPSSAVASAAVSAADPIQVPAEGPGSTALPSAAASAAPEAPATGANAMPAPPRTAGQGTPRPVPATNPGVQSAAAPGPGPAAVVEAPFQPSQGSASVRVTNVTGTTDDAVKAALPLSSYKECYQNELKRTRKRLEGHADLKVAFMSSGSFASATGLASPELSKVGQCCAEATLHTPRGVQSVAAKGGTADVTIVYTIE